MKLTEHFDLVEFTRTAQPYQNIPSQRNIDSLRALCVNVLEPLRAIVGPLHINSGFRSPAVNAAVGGSSSSQHLYGEAADIVGVRCPLTDLWAVIVKGVEDKTLPIDQAIVYQKAPGHGWVHVSYDGIKPPRRQLLVQLRGGAFETWAYFQSEKRQLVLA